MYKQDCILYFLTARGRVRVPVLRDLVSQISSSNDAFVEEPDGIRTYKLCRLLDMLGHVEYDRRDARLNLTSAHFAKLPVLGKERYVIAGARSEATISDISNEAKAAAIHFTLAESHSCTYEPFAPKRVVLSFENPGDAKALAMRLGIGISQSPSSWNLACLSSGLNEFESSLEWHPRNLTMSAIDIYDPNKFAFSGNGTPSDEMFLCRLIADLSSVLIVKKDLEARVNDHDWGRHWAITNSGIAAVHYDSKRQYLAVPAVTPLPRLLARSLSLCSGTAPHLIRQQSGSSSLSYHVFCDVPLVVANKVAEKLGISFLPKAINVPNSP